MSQILCTADPHLRFQCIYDKALEEYEKKTKKDLTSHPLFSRLNACHFADDILAVLRSQIRDFDQSTSSNDKLTKWLDPVVHVLYMFSATVSAGVGRAYPPASVIFTGIGVLLSSAKAVRASHGILADLFERIENFIQRLEAYTKVPENATLTDIIGKVMAEVLSILAIATNEIERGVAKKFFNKLIGRTDIEDALRRLDKLTQDEIRMVAAQGLKAAHHIDDQMTGVSSKVQVVSDQVDGVDERLRVVGEQVNRVLNNSEETKLTNQQMTNDMTEQSQDKLRQKVKEWLSPPDPSVNFNTAYESQHEGTGVWFTQGSMFTEWKQSGSLLWIHGNPGSGKSVLCSAIIKDLKRLSTKTLTCYFYFDFKDARKQDVRALLSSFLIQICGQSSTCCDVLRGLYSRHDNGSHQPSVGALTQCLGDMVKMAENMPIYLVVDAVDECPDRGIPSSRGRVLQVVEQLVKMHLPNLHLCVTSRSERDIQTVLEPLASTCISLHKQCGQSKDIVDYVTSVVHSDEKMKNWREEDRELVIESLSARAGGMFRWVYCQLESLRRCLARNVRRTLESLPTTLDDTYMWILQEIPEENRDDAHRLLQCLTVAVRPLRVEELAEMLAIEFPEGEIPKLREDWRWEDEEQAVLLACSSLISIGDGNTYDEDEDEDEDEDVDEDEDEDCDIPWSSRVDGDYDDPWWGSPVVQFSHFSVKEFLVSDRLAALPPVSYHHILPEPAHTIMAQACLGVLLRLGYNIDWKGIKKLPLVPYAANNWFIHAKFENVISHIRDGIDNLLDTNKPHLSAWLWMLNEPKKPSPGRLQVVPFPFVTNKEFRGLLQYIAWKHPEVITCGVLGTPLHVASASGDAELSQLLLEHCDDVDSRDCWGRTPLHLASRNAHYDIGQMLLDRGADANAWDNGGKTPLHVACSSGAYSPDYGRTYTPQLAQEGGASMDTWDDYHALPPGLTAVWEEAKFVPFSRLLVTYGASPHMRNRDGWTPLHVAAHCRRPAIIQLLLEHGADVNARGNDHTTPLKRALRQGCEGRAAVHSVELLLKGGASLQTTTPYGLPLLHWSLMHSLDIFRFLLDRGVDVNVKDSGHWTPLHIASCEGHLDLAHLLLHRGANVDDQTDDRRTPLHYASYSGNFGITRSLLDHGADVNAHDDTHSTALHLALYGEHLEIVQLLLERGADVDFRNNCGQTPLHLVSWYGHVHIMQIFLQCGAYVNAQDNYHSTPLHLASHNGELEATRLLLQWSAKVHAQTNDGQTPLHYASQGNYSEIMRLLLEYGADVMARDNEHSTPLHLVASKGWSLATQVLLEYGAKVHVQNKKGETPFQIASAGGHCDLAQTLVDHIHSH